MRLFLCASALASLACAQPVIRVTTRLVDLSVIARDGKGPVADLSRDDFTVFDNGVERPIAFFSVSSAAPPAKAAPAQPKNVFTNRAELRGDAPERLTVFVLDALNTEFASQARMRSQLAKSVGKLGPHDRAAIWVLSDKLQRVQDFTGDRDRLVAAVERVKPSVWLTPDRPSPISARAPANDGEALSLADAKTAEDMQQYYRLQLTNDLMRDLATALARIPGRKNVVWLSSAFPINMSIGPGGPEIGYVTDRLTGTGKALAKGNAALYPVDVGGLVAPAGGQSALAVSMSERNRHESMQVIADATGGRAVFDTNDIAAAVDAVLDDAQVSYTLGFYPAEGGADADVHKVRVEVARRGVTLRYRDLYVGGDSQPASAASDEREAVYNALLNPLEESGIPITARLDPRDPKRADWARLTISIPPAELTPGGTFNLIVEQRAADGHNLGAVQAEVPAKDAATLHRQVQLSPGAAQMRIVVLDHASGRVGSLDLPAR